MSQQENGGAARPKDQDFADRQLIEDCLAGKEFAWRQLNQRVLRRMHAYAKKAWRREAGNKSLFEELAVDLLASLFLNRGILQAHLCFGRNLNGYLDFLIRRAFKHHYHAVDQERRRFIALCAAGLVGQKKDAEPPGLMQQLLEILTPAEKNYLQWVAESGGLALGPYPYQPAYARQLEHRIAAKFRSLLTGDEA
jgi:hypothetical protein